MLSRREFLRLSSISILGIRFNAYAQNQRPARFWGRVIFVYATIYSRPSVFAATGIIHPPETVLPIYSEVEGEDESAYNKRWYETDNGFIHSSNVQPVLNIVNKPQAIASPVLGEVTIPFVDALTRPQPKAAVSYRFYFSSTHWVQRAIADGDGNIWYEVRDDRTERAYFVPATALRIIPASELTPLSPAVTEKQIHIDTTAETITAFESERSVFTTRISSGGMFGEGKDFRTPLGDYVIDRKRPSRHMAAGDGVADDAYDLPGVPWVSYFNGGIAIHGTYWHNDFGRPWSHGCINLLSQDAKWFYRWTMPAVNHDQDLVEAKGTTVRVI